MSAHLSPELVLKPANITLPYNTRFTSVYITMTVEQPNVTPRLALPLWVSRLDP